MKYDKLENKTSCPSSTSSPSSSPTSIFTDWMISGGHECKSKGFWSPRPTVCWLPPWAPMVRRMHCHERTEDPRIRLHLSIYSGGSQLGWCCPCPGGNIWRHCGCYNCWGESYWNLLGRNQGCCSTFHNTEDSSHYQKDPVPNVKSAKIQKPIPSPYVPGEFICSSWNHFSCAIQVEPFFPLAPMLSVRHLHSR